MPTPAAEPKPTYPPARHADQVDDIDKAIGAHADLLQQVSQGMNAFYGATVELGCADKVTAFTASDFGRTFTSNGDGSDDGWGAHHLVVGGAVNGGGRHA